MKLIQACPHLSTMYSMKRESSLKFHLAALNWRTRAWLTRSKILTIEITRLLHNNRSLNIARTTRIKIESREYMWERNTNIIQHQKIQILKIHENSHVKTYKTQYTECQKTHNTLSYDKCTEKFFEKNHGPKKVYDPPKMVFTWGWTSAVTATLKSIAST